MTTTRTLDPGVLHDDSITLTGAAIMDIDQFVFTGFIRSTDGNNTVIGAEYIHSDCNPEYPTTLSVRRHLVTKNGSSVLNCSLRVTAHIEVNNNVSGEVTWEKVTTVSAWEVPGQSVKDGLDMSKFQHFLVRLNYYWTGSAWVHTCNHFARLNLGKLDILDNQITTSWGDPN